MPDAAAERVRPKFLTLTEIRLPLPGFVSILHRLSGAGLFLCLPFVLYLFDLSLESEASFRSFQALVSGTFVKLVLFGLMWAFLHHFCAGIRFLLLDVHKGVDLPRARRSAGAVLVVSLVLTLFAGVWLW